ncbi:MAG: hypothetical protein HUU55_04895 [Myxococcales bacterium]|nr:hypothetical protein [Myxococcales bacterium]
MKRWTLALAFMTATAVAMAPAERANAADWSLFGGNTLPDTDTALRVGVGWPDISAAYHYPISDIFEIAPKFSIFYGIPVFGLGADLCCGIGNTFGAELRVELFESGGFHLAFRADPALLLNYTILSNGVEAGIQLGLGIAVDYSVSDSVNVVSGFEVPLQLYFTDPVAGLAPLLVDLGVEFMPSDELSLFVMMRLGPSVFFAGDASDVGFGYEGRIGVAFRFL